jgi:hypothetical protein
MRNFSRAAAAALLLNAAAHAAGQAAQHGAPLPQYVQDTRPAPDPAPSNPNPDPNANNPNPNPNPGPNQNPSPNSGDNQPTVTVFDRLEVQGILGKEVRGPSNEDMGRIVDVIVDRSGQVRAAIIDFGGFLGVGNRRVAVAWNALRFPPDPKDPKKVDRIGLDLTREQVQAAPEYKEDKPVVVLGASGSLESLPF